jgi:hypothetical protein
MKRIETANINWEELIKSNLPTEIGYEHAVNFQGIPMATIDKVFDSIATDYEEVCDFNSWEWDWGQNIIIGGKTYHIWGSAHSGSLCIQLED